ncbi:hypothetical protein KTAU_31010 [Thermogemmatispora aurantia]|nr:hypothetical protein KTAU_31010 [Thermogemmatispora aurantia]
MTAERLFGPGAKPKPLARGAPGRAAGVGARSGIPWRDGCQGREQATLGPLALHPLTRQIPQRWLPAGADRASFRAIQQQREAWTAPSVGDH